MQYTLTLTLEIDNQQTRKIIKFDEDMYHQADYTKLVEEMVDHLKETNKAL